jgi:putative flippase GtrA
MQMKVERGDGRQIESDIQHSDWLRERVEALPRPFRFLAVGTCGLVTDLGVFTAIPMHAANPLTSRAVSLAVATLVTWRLNRALTFDASGRTQGEEAVRYASVTLMSQGTSFVVFSLLVLTVFAWLPQAAIITGAAIGAAIAYIGHSIFAFAPREASSKGDRA